MSPEEKTLFVFIFWECKIIYMKQTKIELLSFNGKSLHFILQWFKWEVKLAYKNLLGNLDTKCSFLLGYSQKEQALNGLHWHLCTKF